MKNLKLRRLTLVSHRERAAKTVAFDDRTTVVLGENDTGKSSLIKSVYAAFGADPAVQHPRWRSAAPVSLVDFDIDQNSFSLLRSSGLYGLFDHTGNVIWTASGVVSGVAPRLAELFGIELRMQSRTGEFITPPPSYFFAPFYVDQDAGWQRNWNSFADLRMFERYRESLALFHAGVRPNEYYAAQAKKIDADRSRSQLTNERAGLERAAKRLRADRRVLAFDLRPEDFAKEIDRLTMQATELRTQQDSIKASLARLTSQRAVLVEQIAIASATLKELNADFAYLGASVEPEVICPTCGTLHQNDFAKKFSLASDVDACRTFVVEAQAELAETDVLIAAEKRRFDALQANIDPIDSLLNETLGDVKLRDIIEGESERLIDETLDAELAQLNELIGSYLAISEEAAATMKALSDAKRERRIKNYFAGALQSYVAELRVPTLPPRFFSSLYGNPPETGSDQPRALLAYYYAFAQTVREHSSALLAPLVIDSPVQQDQDPKNARRMIEFALSNVPPDMQLILGTVRLQGAEYGGYTIELTEKYSLLEEEGYREANARVLPLLELLVQQDPETRLV